MINWYASEWQTVLSTQNFICILTRFSLKENEKKFDYSNALILYRHACPVKSEMILMTNVPEITDLLRYCRMFEIFGGKISD